MADTAATRCNETCGCPYPCPGGTSCRCATGAAVPSSTTVQHSYCKCGDHCSCNPCECIRTAAHDDGGAVRASCSCRPSCICKKCKT